MPHDEIDGTIVDFNRCGVPLIEMVTRPDLHSSAEAKEFPRNDQDYAVLPRYLRLQDGEAPSAAT